MQNALQAQALFVARDLARHAHVFERRHVDHVAPRQRDVRSDARALLPQRLLGDLNDDLLAFLEQIGDGGLRDWRREPAARRCAPARGPARTRDATSGRDSPRGICRLARLAHGRTPLRSAACAGVIGAKRDADSGRRARAPPRFRCPVRRRGARLQPRAVPRRALRPPASSIALIDSFDSTSLDSSSRRFDVAQDHRLNVAILFLVEHRSDRRTGSVVLRFGFAASSSTSSSSASSVRSSGFRQGRWPAARHRRPAPRACTGASGSAFSGG